MKRKRLIHAPARYRVGGVADHQKVSRHLFPLSCRIWSFQHMLRIPKIFGPQTARRGSSGPFITLHSPRLVIKHNVVAAWSNGMCVRRGSPKFRPLVLAFRGHSRSAEVTQFDTVRSSAYDFLLVIHNNCGSILYWSVVKKLKFLFPMYLTYPVR